MLFSGMFKTKNSRRSSTVTKAILFGFLYLFLFVYLGIAFGSIFFILGLSLGESGSLDLYFPMLILFSTLFGMMGTMMSAEKLLFEGKDNDLLLSMPIPPSYILATRLVSLATLECAFSLVVLHICRIFSTIFPWMWSGKPWSQVCSGAPDPPPARCSVPQDFQKSRKPL